MVYQQAGLLAEMGDCFRHNTYMYILYLRHEDAILVIPCIGVSIIITISYQWLNSLTFHDNVKYITANRQTVIYVGDN